MNGEGYGHLQEERIIWAVVDEKELVPEELQHLRNCPACAMKVAQFQAQLRDFGEKARQAVPPLARPVTLPREKASPVSSHVGWLPFFGAAAMAAFALFFYFAEVETRPVPQVEQLQSRKIVLEDEFLMQEISALVEDPLTEEMHVISGDDGAGFDDDFWDFAVPDNQDDFQS